MNSQRNISILVLALGFLAVAGLAGQADYEDAVLEQAAYCANVSLYNSSAGTQGWPDYNHNYSELCGKNSTL